MVLPEGFVVPPWYVLVPLVLVFAGVVALLWTLEPPVTDRTIVAFTPWMMLGSALYVLHQIGAYPPAVASPFSTPTVYLTTATVAGAVWVLASFLYAAGLRRSIERPVGVVGTVALVGVAGAALWIGHARGTLDLFWPVVAVVLTGVVAALAWLSLGVWFTEVAAVTGATGSFVVFAHALDGVSTAVGYDVLGASEDVPASQIVLEIGRALPTYEYVGAGWLFALVKVALAAAIVGLFTDFVREEPRRARIVLGLVAAVGLGPGAHNVLLFAAA